MNVHWAYLINFEKCLISFIFSGQFIVLGEPPEVRFAKRFLPIIIVQYSLTFVLASGEQWWNIFLSRIMLTVHLCCDLDA